MKILISIINFKCEQEVIKYAKNLEQLECKSDIFLVVVDNMQSEGAIGVIEQALENIDINSKYLIAQENLGYLNGVFYGFDWFKEQFEYLPNWLVISNTDIIIEDMQFYKKFIETNYDEKIWCVCPSVLSLNKKRYCNPHYKQRIPIKQMNRNISVFSSTWKSNLFLRLSAIKGTFRKSTKENSQYVYSSHGCYFMLRKEFYEYLDNEKYGAFLYSEESYIAEKILLAGKSEFYDSNIELWHHESLSTGKIDKSKKYKMMADSMKYVRDKFYK